MGKAAADLLRMNGLITGPTHSGRVTSVPVAQGEGNRQAFTGSVVRPPGDSNKQISEEG